MEKIIVSQKKSTTLLYIICMAFACAFMTYLTFNLKAGGGVRTRWLFSIPFGIVVTKVFLAVFALICAYCVVFFIKRLADPKPLIIADESGFTDNSSSSSVGFVPWRDVKRIYIVTMKHNKLIQVELAYPEEYLDRMSGLARKTAELNMKLGYQPISFSLNGTDKKPDKFLADMISIWERNK